MNGKGNVLVRLAPCATARRGVLGVGAAAAVAAPGAAQAAHSRAARPPSCSVATGRTASCSALLLTRCVRLACRVHMGTMPGVFVSAHCTSCCATRVVSSVYGLCVRGAGYACVAFCACRRSPRPSRTILPGDVRCHSLPLRARFPLPSPALIRPWCARPSSRAAFALVLPLVSPLRCRLVSTAAAPLVTPTRSPTPSSSAR